MSCEKEIVCKHLTMLRTVQKHSSNIQWSLDKSLLQSTSYRAKFQITSWCNSLDSLCHIEEEVTLWARSDRTHFTGVSQSEDWCLPSLYSAQESDGVGTRRESMLAGWKLLYRLQELIKPSLEQSGINRERSCALCLKPARRQGIGAPVPAPRAAGAFVQ